MSLSTFEVFIFISLWSLICFWSLFDGRCLFLKSLYVFDMFIMLWSLSLFLWSLCQFLKSMSAFEIFISFWSQSGFKVSLKSYPFLKSLSGFEISKSWNFKVCLCYWSLFLLLRSFSPCLKSIIGYLSFFEVFTRSRSLHQFLKPFWSLRPPPLDKCLVRYAIPYRPSTWILNVPIMRMVYLCSRLVMFIM